METASICTGAEHPGVRKGQYVPASRGHNLNGNDRMRYWVSIQGTVPASRGHNLNGNICQPVQQTGNTGNVPASRGHNLNGNP